MSLLATLKALYRSEINVEISSFYDGDWTIRFGDNLNGFPYETIHCSTEQLELALKEGAIAFYPTSDFVLEKTYAADNSSNRKDEEPT